MLRWSHSVLNPEPANDIIGLEEKCTMSLVDSILPVEQASIIYQHQLSALCSNENKAAMIIYYYMSVPSRINLDHCSMHPAITEIKKTILM